LSLVVILIWFYRYGRFQLGDADYVDVKRGMWASLKLWTALLIVQLILILYMLKTPAPAA
jgi:hypothetical protein